MFKQILFVSFLFLLQYALPANAQQTSKFQPAFKAFQNNAGIKNASIGFCLMDAENGKVLFRYNDSASLVPASCLKIATTGAALGLLGADHVFTTTISHSGEIDATGTLHGNIVLTGGGDPTLGDDKSAPKIDLATFVNAIKKAGIKKIDGKIMTDARYFEDDQICPTWVWNDIGNYFGCGVSGLNYGENVYNIKLQPGDKAGEKVHVVCTMPDNLLFHFDNQLQTGPPHSGDESNIFGAGGDSLRTLEGTVPAQGSFTIKGALPDPNAWVAKELALMFHKEGLLADENKWAVISKQEKALEVFKIASFQSPPLSDIVHYANLNSINLYADCLCKEMGKKSLGSGSWIKGTRAVKKYWSQKGIDTLGLFMDDGSGLSRYDGITAFQLAKMLASIKKENFFEVFLHSLPISGQNGAMKTMGKGTACEGKLYCKTGHMDRARAYSGYFKSSSGKWMCFSLLVNNYSLSSAQIHDEIEKLLEAMMEVDDKN